jgi:hypothetical protein
MLQLVRWLPRVCLLSLAALVTAACGHALPQGAARGAAPAAAKDGGKLMLFGGPEHKTYLGCLNCPRAGNDSVLNERGAFGSRSSPKSVSNRFGAFGSRASDYSACNPNAEEPPVVMDSAGHVYGRLTLNVDNAQLVGNDELLAWISAVCGS